MEAWLNFEKLMVLIFESLFKVELLIKLNNFSETFSSSQIPRGNVFLHHAKIVHNNLLVKYHFKCFEKNKIAF